ESNLIGNKNEDGISIGSGGWVNIMEKYTKAKQYCDAPFEVQYQGSKKKQVPIAGEWIGERRAGDRTRSVDIRCVSSTEMELPQSSVDAVFTDPPYFGSVQYAELMDFCFVWLRRLVRDGSLGFERPSTRAIHELTENETEGRDLEHFAEGLAVVYRR